KNGSQHVTLQLAPEPLRQRLIAQIVLVLQYIARPEVRREDEQLRGNGINGRQHHQSQPRILADRPGNAIVQCRPQPKGHDGQEAKRDEKGSHRGGQLQALIALDTWRRRLKCVNSCLGHRAVYAHTKSFYRLDGLTPEAEDASYRFGGAPMQSTG